VSTLSGSDRPKTTRSPHEPKEFTPSCVHQLRNSGFTASVRSARDSHEFVFGSRKHKRYYDNALRRMQEALATVDMDDVWDGQ